MIQFSGLKVSIVSALADTIDSITQRRKYKSGLVIAETRTVSNSYNITGLQGTSMLQYHLKVTALTRNSSARVYMIFQRLMPDGTSYMCQLQHEITTTEDIVFNLYAEGGADSVALSGFGTNNTEVPGVWGDSCRAFLYWDNVGSFSITYSLHYLAMA